MCVDYVLTVDTPNWGVINVGSVLASRSYSPYNYFVLADLFRGESEKDRHMARYVVNSVVSRNGLSVPVDAFVFRYLEKEAYSTMSRVHFNLWYRVVESWKLVMSDLDFIQAQADSRRMLLPRFDCEVGGRNAEEAANRTDIMSMLMPGYACAVPVERVSKNWAICDHLHVEDWFGKVSDSKRVERAFHAVQNALSADFYDEAVSDDGTTHSNVGYFDNTCDSVQVPVGISLHMKHSVDDNYHKWKYTLASFLLMMPVLTEAKSIDSSVNRSLIDLFVEFVILYEAAEYFKIFSVYDVVLSSVFYADLGCDEMYRRPYILEQLLVKILNSVGMYLDRFVISYYMYAALVSGSFEEGLKRYIVDAGVVFMLCLIYSTLGKNLVKIRRPLVWALTCWLQYSWFHKPDVGGGYIGTFAGWYFIINALMHGRRITHQKILGNESYVFNFRDFVHWWG